MMFDPRSFGRSLNFRSSVPFFSSEEKILRFLETPSGYACIFSIQSIARVLRRYIIHTGCPKYYFISLSFFFSRDVFPDIFAHKFCCERRRLMWKNFIQCLTKFDNDLYFVITVTYDKRRKKHKTFIRCF